MVRNAADKTAICVARSLQDAPERAWQGSKEH
jgi:hypothetical protein